MKCAPDTEDLRLWTIVAQTVRPLKPTLPLVGRAGDAEHRRVGESAASANPKPPIAAAVTAVAHQGAARPALPVKGREAPQHVELGLHRRIVRGREAVAARIDLHGLTYEDARATLTDFILRSVAQGWRAVLVITGKGALGDGVLKRHTPEWLGQPPLREHVAGISEAHRRHGGEGALYVALRRSR